MTPSLGIEPGLHWWKASALTTAPSLQPGNGFDNDCAGNFKELNGWDISARKLEISLSEHNDKWRYFSGIQRSVKVNLKAFMKQNNQRIMNNRGPIINIFNFHPPKLEPSKVRSY